MLLLCALLARSAHAEPGVNGRWKAIYSTEASESVEADVAIDGDAGTWVVRSRSGAGKGDGCVGTSRPISISDSGSSTLSLVIRGSIAMEGCRDRKARVTVVGPETLEGEFDDGRIIKLVRP